MAAELHGRVALVVGAGSALGAAAARALGAAGARVAVNDWSDSAAERVAAELAAAGGEALACAADASKKLALQTVVEDVLAAWGQIDVLVNASAVEPRASLLAMDEWDWRRALDLNLSSAFTATQVLGRVFKEAGSGVILNVVAPEAAAAISPAYATAAGGVRALTVAAQRELEEHGIRVHLIESKPEDLGESLVELAARGMSAPADTQIGANDGG